MSEENNTIRTKKKSIFRSKVEKIGYREYRDGLRRFTLLGSTALFGAVVWPVAAFAAETTEGLAAATAVSETDDQASGEVILVTGSRSGTTEFRSLSPVSVVGAATLESTGEPDLRTALGAVVPSYLASQASNGFSFAKPVRQAALRGLGGNHVLVLVNGRRRHGTSLLNNTGGSAGAPVDLALIPATSIARIEVLSDGASAQYGSDAISGVINIILKGGGTGGSFSAQAGIYDDESIADVGGISDSGFTTVLNFHQGFDFGDGGFINLSADYRDVKTSNVVGPIGPPTTRVRTIYAVPGDPRELSESRYKQLTEATPFGEAANFGYNFELPLSDEIDFYAFGTFGVSSLGSTGTYRSENNPVHILGIAPDGGYVPTLTTEQRDYQATAGLRGDDLLGFDWDLSGSFAQNRARMYVNGINASLGPAARYRDIYIGQVQVSEGILNLDIRRPVETGLFAAPLDIALGVEYRHNDYSQGVGEYESYANGGYIYPADYPSPILAGTAAGVGSPFMMGFTPEEVGKWGRSNWAAYLDFSQEVSSNLSIGLAGRYEHYSDFGGSLSGKLSARYEIIPELALRATVNNGFRAPLLGEQYATKANQGPFNTGTEIIQINAYNSLRLDHPAAIALGAKPLDPERSLNYSIGLVAKPIPDLNLSLDVFQIAIDDRIGLTGSFNGTANNAQGQAIAAALAAAGQDPLVRIQYFTNIGDTRTRGVEFKAGYLADLDDLGTLNLSLATAYNRQKVTRTTPAPANLAAVGLVLLQAPAAYALEHGTPKHISRVSADWEKDGFAVRAAGAYYSSTESLNATFPTDPRYNSGSEAAFIADLSVSYDVHENATLTFGANNILNRRAEDQQPLLVERNTVGSINPSPVQTPYGRGGRFSYARLNLRW